ncbi:MAG: tRNA nucleotidyltransferase, partial [Desulfovibrio piger]
MKTTVNPLFFRLLCAAQPGDLLRRLLLAGQGPRLNFLADAPRIPAGPLPYHAGSVLDHLARCMNAVAGNPPAVWMALAHD